MVLAAGTSSRLGRPKQLLPVGGKPLAQHAVDVAAAAGLHEIVVVVGYAGSRVVAALTLPPGARAVPNPDFTAGQSGSLRVGLEALSSEARAAVVLLADQPGVSVEAVRRVVAAYREDAGPVVQATYGGQPGHPVVLDRSVWPDIEAVEGDAGAREVLARHPELVTRVELGGDPPPDIDTWEDYQRLAGEAERLAGGTDAGAG